MSREWESGNPMKNPRKLPNLSTGSPAIGNTQTSTFKGAAGSQMGPSIGKGYLVDGDGHTRATGGSFAKTNTAPDKMGARKVKKGKAK